jgi:hypothetical protein
MLPSSHSFDYIEERRVSVPGDRERKEERGWKEVDDRHQSIVR